MSGGAFSVRLERLRDLSGTTRDFRFVRTDGKAMGYRPGQFFRFLFTDAGGQFERSYSLCNFDELYGPHLDLLISKVRGGRATQLLFNCRPGIEARVTGPFGRLLLPDAPPGRLLMVATSVGLAPYMPMLRELEGAGYRKVVMLLGVRDRSEFIYAAELLNYAQKHGFFELRLCLSRQAASRDHERDGYVNQELQALDVNPAHDHVLLCGNPAMIDDAWRFLQASGFRARQVIREKYLYAKEKKRQPKVLSAEEKRLIAAKMKKYRS